MSPSQLFEPTYREIRRLLRHGRWPPGQRLDTARLADQLDVSKSPVRDSLNRLAGERMVDFTVGVGFHVPVLDTLRLENLFDLNQRLLRSVVFGGKQTCVAREIPPDEPAACAACLFHELAASSGNSELIQAVEGLSDRLWAVRRLDATVLADPMTTLNTLDQTLRTGNTPSALRSLIDDYHRQRRRRIGAYVRIIMRG